MRSEKREKVSGGEKRRDEDVKSSINFLLVGSTAMSCPIEMEFAVDFEQAANDPERVLLKFAFLQMRAMAGALKQVIHDERRRGEE